MSFPAFRWAMVNPDAFAGLSAPERLVLIVCCNYAGMLGEGVRPSVSTLVKLTCLSDRTVQKSLKGLVARNILQIVTAGGGQSRPTEYRLVADLSPYQKGASPAEFGAPSTPKSGSLTPQTSPRYPEAHSPDPITQHVREPVRTGSCSSRKNDTGSAAQTSETPQRIKPPIKAERFQTWWNAYPRKENHHKQAALAAYRRALEKGVTEAQLIQAIANHQLGTNWYRIPWPQTWLDDERWTDEPYES